MVTYGVSLSAYFIAFSAIQLMLVLIIVVIKPYKEKLSVYGTIDVIFVLHMAMWSASLTGVQIAGTKDLKSLGFSAFVTGILMLLPLLYIPVLLLIQLWTKRRKCMNHAFSCLKKKNRRLRPVTSEHPSQDDDNFGTRDDEREKINWSQKTGSYTNL